MNEPTYRWGGKFYTNWLLDRIHAPPFKEIVREYAGRENLKILEIGCLEGQCTLWFLTFVAYHPTSKVFCVDPHSTEWKPYKWPKGGAIAESHLKAIPPGDTIYDRFKENILDKYSDKVEYFRDISGRTLRKIDERFDIVLVDGCHSADCVLEDIILTWRDLKVGGTMMIDDILLSGNWGHILPVTKSPYAAAAAFFQCFEGQYTVTCLRNLALVKKIRED